MTTPAISATTSAAANTASIFSGGTEEGSSSGLSTDFETFLKMLTTQAKYQDPLEPLDSSEYASQLAQFSQVEQQVQTNDLLSAMQSQMNVSAMATMSGWVGMEARATVDGYFDGASPITIVPPAALSNADSAKLVVRDEDGKVVDRIALPDIPEPMDWDGLDDQGQAYSEGLYSFTAENYDKEGTLIKSEQADLYMPVVETQMKDNQVHLILAGGSAINASSVSALRDGRS